MIAYIDYICAGLVRILNLIFHFLPIRFILWLGRQCGIIVYLINAPRRIIGYTNLRAVFCKRKSPRELAKLTRGVYRSLTEVFFEILALTRVNEKYIDKYIEIVNTENIFKVIGHPDGIIFLTAHFGNWELSGMASAIKGFPIVVLARAQSMKRLDGLINKLRESKGLQIVRKGITTKYIVKALHQGKMIGMVGDQNAGKTGVFVDFFGRPTSTAPGTAKIASKTGAFILPAFMARVKGPYHKLILEEPIKIKKGEDITPYLARYNKLLEKHITMYPEQWLWLHKRWKATPIKKVTVISDGKKGHLNQSLALSRELKRYRERSGYIWEDTKVEIVDAKFKNKFTKILLPFLALFSGKRCQGCMRCLRFCLRRDFYEELIRRYSDIVISCGSSVAAVNRFFSIENNAKSAVLMKPSILGLNKFDMAVLPWHDRKKGTSNGSIIVTETVPNLIDEEYLKNSSREISRIAKLEMPKTSGASRIIGVLLGGDNSDFALTENITKELLDNIVDASNKLSADILFTTSRRTPKPAERAVKMRLREEARCKLLVIANEKNIPHAVGGILGLSDMVIVSGESASMVSEAIQSKKRVIVLKLKKKKKKSKTGKFERMLGRLEEKKYIIIADTEDLSRVICRNFDSPRKGYPPQDSHNIYKYMWRLGI